MLKKNVAAVYAPSPLVIAGEVLLLLAAFVVFCIAMGSADAIDAWIIAGG